MKCFAMENFESLSINEKTVQTVIQFRDRRKWSQFHNPKDLAISLSLEAAELLECFQWSGSDTEVTQKREAMKEELSDVLIYALLIADRLKIDLNEAILEKIDQNEKKYPIEKSYGRSVKYDKL